MPQSVIGLVNDIAEADVLVTALRDAGFNNTDISMLLPDDTGMRDFAYEKHSKAPEGGTTGAGTGAVVGGALGWLAGIGAIAVPGLGAFIAAGPVMAALGGIAVGGAVGGLAGTLIGMGIPEYEAKMYEGKLKEGSILVAVHTDNKDEAKRAHKLFEQVDARDVNCVQEENIRKSA